MAAAKKRIKAKKAVRRRRRKTGEPYLVLVEHRLRFKTSDPVSVAAAIASLRGMDRIVRTQLPKAIHAITGANVKVADVHVAGLEDGSFVEDLLIRLLFKTKGDYEQFVGHVADTIKSAHHGGTPVLKVAVGVLVGALLVGCLDLLPSTPTQSGALSNIQGDNNAVIIVGAEAYKSTPAEFQKAIDKAIGKTSVKRSAQAALDATAPAREQGASLEIAGDDHEAIQVISAATARDLPKEVTPVDASEDVSYSKLKVRLRALDYDSATRGWAGTIPGYLESRTRLVFADPSMLPQAIHQAEIEADVTVTYSSPSHQRAVLIMIDKIY